MKLLIAEDEPNAREGLLQCVPPCYTDVRTCANGQAAYEAALEMKPCVVLCDIRMPKLNGIELAKLLRAHFPEIHILFISGYADKEYLKAAISLQADGYLEKPIDEGELTDHLTRIAQQIRRRAKSQSLQERNAQYAHLFARRQLLHALLRGGEPLEDTFAKHPQLSEELLSADSYIVACITFSWADTLSAQLIDTAQRQIVDAVTRHFPKHTLCGALTNTRIGIVSYGAIGQKEIMSRLEDILSEAQQAVPHPLCACACVAQEAKAPESLPSRYSACLLQAQWQLFAAGHGICVSALSNQPLAPLPDSSARLNALLSSHQFDEAKSLITSQTQEIMQLPNGSIDAVRKSYEMLLSVCLNAENVAPPSVSSSIARLNIFSAFAKLHSLDALSRFILVYIDNLLPSIALPKTACAKVDEAVSYIRNNLSNPALSVQSIAAELGLTENYLSTLFRRETGTTLHKVITEMRLERAKYLIAKKHRLSDVAKKTGFSSAAYLHAVFKKHVGCSPSDYAARQQARPQEDCL